MLEIALHDAKNYDMANVLNSLILAREQIVITQPTGEKFLMVALPFDVDKKASLAQTKRPTFGSAKGKIIIADDFDEPLMKNLNIIP